MYRLPAGYGKRPRSSAPKKRKQPERALQTRVAALLDKYLDPQIPWTCIGHGVFLTGDREQAEIRGGILKRMGVKKGWPDVIIYWHGRLIGIELKSAVGSLTDEQKAVRCLITIQRGTVVTCRTEEEVMDFLEVAGIPMVAKLMPAERAVLRAQALATTRTARKASRSRPDDGMPPLLSEIEI